MLERTSHCEPVSMLIRVIKLRICCTHCWRTHTQTSAYAYNVNKYTYTRTYIYEVYNRLKALCMCDLCRICINCLSVLLPASLFHCLSDSPPHWFCFSFSTFCTFYCICFAYYSLLLLYLNKCRNAAVRCPCRQLVYLYNQPLYCFLSYTLSLSMKLTHHLFLLLFGEDAFTFSFYFYAFIRFAHILHIK